MSLDPKISVILHNSGIEFDPSIFDENKSFRNNKIDSLDVFNILLAFEDIYKIKLSDDEISELVAPIDLIRNLEKRGLL